jgi:hypothetical protein
MERPSTNENNTKELDAFFITDPMAPVQKMKVDTVVINDNNSAKSNQRRMQPLEP